MLRFIFRKRQNLSNPGSLQIIQNAYNTDTDSNNERRSKDDVADSGNSLGPKRKKYGDLKLRLELESKMKDIEIEELKRKGKHLEDVQKKCSEEN